MSTHCRHYCIRQHPTSTTNLLVVLQPIACFTVILVLGAAAVTHKDPELKFPLNSPEFLQIPYFLFLRSWQSVAVAAPPHQDLHHPTPPQPIYPDLNQ
eukprot:scaffold10385_cov46-Cyclotella_meneghiniana.AAC.1